MSQKKKKLKQEGQNRKERLKIYCLPLKKSPDLHMWYELNWNNVWNLFPCKKNKDQNNITVNTVLVPLWLTLISFKYYPGVSIVNFEQANVSYIISSLSTTYNKHLQAWFLLKLSFNCYVQKCIFQICSPEVTYSSKKTFMNWCGALSQTETVKCYRIS